MIFKPATWFRIAVVLSVANLVAVGFTAAGSAEPWHIVGHAALALGFGLWAQRLGQRSRANETQGQVDGLEVDRLEAFEDEMSKLRQELSETQERLDFAERLLAQGAESRRVGPPR
jgi:hypothetical protein